MTEPPPPDPQAIAENAERLAPYLRKTPVWLWKDELVARLLPPRTKVLLKLELFQHAGSFKARGALTNLLRLDAEARARGVTAVSAGNHAVAVAWAARTMRTTARVVMPRTADPLRIARCRELGADAILAPGVREAFAVAQEIEREEGRAFVHPFESEGTFLGTATLGAELLRQAPTVEAVVVPVGGGGLAAGLASAVKQLRPEIEVFGVEPEGNDVMRRSLESGLPEQAAAGGPHTIADSLNPPYTLPMSLGLCRRFLDDLVLVSDDALQEALALLFRSARLAVEPAAAAGTAALLGPLRDRLAGRRVALIICGTIITPSRYSEYLARGTELLAARLPNEEARLR
ncbi:MAG: threonine ammonia-lyase [Gemmatimonadales bacterium]